jgi:hypothetical protein
MAGERRPDLFRRAARAVGFARLRADPASFSALLERTIGDHEGFFVPPSPEAMSSEARSLHGHRLEDLIDEAVGLAAELYPGRRRDAVLMAIAVQAERVMHRIRTDPWQRGASFLSERLTRITKLWGSLSLVEDRAMRSEG